MVMRTYHDHYYIIVSYYSFSVTGVGDMSASFLSVLVSSLENYKVLLRQNEHAKEVRSLSQLFFPILLHRLLLYSPNFLLDKQFHPAHLYTFAL